MTITASEEPAEVVPVISGVVVPAPLRLSVRDVDARHWDEKDHWDAAVHYWLIAQRSQHTRDAYRRDITQWHEWCDDEGVPINDARRADVDEWRDLITARPEAPATVARRLCAVSSFYDYWLAEDVLTRNPAKNAKRPKVSSAPGSIALSRRHSMELMAYVDTLEDKRTGLIVRLLAETGMRVGELTGARVSDLRYTSGHHTVTVTRKGGEQQELTITGSTYERIQDYLNGRSDGWIITVKRTERRTSDGRMDRAYVRVLLRRAGRDAGLPREVWERLHPHVMRHSAATLLAADGVPLHEIQALLGHADLRTTQRYIHHAESLDASPGYRLAQLISGQKGA
jgi:integrase/recombinase XerD